MIKLNGRALTKASKNNNKHHGRAYFKLNIYMNNPYIDWNLSDCSDAWHILFQTNEQAARSAFSDVERLRKAGAALWDGITDILTQEQIDKIERLFNKELNLFLI